MKKLIETFFALFLMFGPACVLVMALLITAYCVYLFKGVDIFESDPLKIEEM